MLSLRGVLSASSGSPTFEVRWDRRHFLDRGLGRALQFLNNVPEVKRSPMESATIRNHVGLEQVRADQELKHALNCGEHYDHFFRANSCRYHV